MSAPSVQTMDIVIVGHVDHGKSTIIGRLLADTHSLPDGKLEQVKQYCANHSRPFEFAYLLDALKDEQAQGITIDAARIFFKTEKRNYMIIDAPGHIEFLRNMVTGASRAESALLVIDAQEGIQENSKRHGFLLSFLGIKQVAVVVNKMDLVNYDEAVFEKIQKEYNEFLSQLNIKPISYIPVSGLNGENIAQRSSKMNWYDGKTVLGQLDAFEAEKNLEELPFRFPVQDVYKFTAQNDSRRIVAGTVQSGRVSVGDEVVFYPSGKRSQVKSIEGFNQKTKDKSIAGEATGFTLNEQIYITRGEVMVRAKEKAPHVTSRIEANLFWLGKKSAVTSKEYLLKIGTTKIPVTIEKVVKSMDASDLKSQVNPTEVKKNEVAECVFKLKKAISFDLSSEHPVSSRFVLVDDYEISGGGIISNSLEDQNESTREKVFKRNIKWEKSFISRSDREKRLHQKGCLILLTGPKTTDKKNIAKELEKSLFEEGKMPYFLGIGNVLYGVDASSAVSEDNSEQMRKLAEASYLLIEAGLIVIVTASDLTQKDLETIQTSISSDLIKTVWLGEMKSDFSADLTLQSDQVNVQDSLIKIKNYLGNLSDES